ncbi:MAG: bifunctional diguanylate cyclase/phosphodiesterase [Devosia sp.]|uniref:bifunctional diguanylate cyclase/phosphodiesterase n=1 Tax=Devosia sp. TaxID=1871048 RepID=UPI00260628AE|nr:EAL domain-containing protein [Devosia sp.]MDB5529014.1 bifunctional diguanylate cyclase/phosphodiesterase [Devosia sp.]
MQTVLTTLFFHHDLRLVALAAVICALSAFAGISLLGHAQKIGPGRMRTVWLAIAAGSVGFGVWATHFVGMLAFAIGMPTGYDLWMTLLSLALAIVVTGAGFWVATVGNRRSDKALGGAIVGIGIAGMHYVGMVALMIGGNIVWDSTLVASSLILAIVFGAAALLSASLGTGVKSHLGGTVLLTIAICAMHFTGMGAAGLQNCYAIVSAADATPQHLALAVAVGSIMVLLTALMALRLDLRDEKRTALEGHRMRGLADAAVEGLMVCLDDTIVTVNASFRALVGQDDAEVTGQPLSAYFDSATCSALLARHNVAVEADLMGPNGVSVPVEVILREVDYGGKPHHVVAVRDLSARRQAEQHIRFLAHHDALTGLPNRASFNRHLESEIALATRQGQSFAVLCLDLDRFKEVNDLFGHPAGDVLLRRVGQSLLSSIGDKAFAARIGGDEFSVIIPDIGSPARAGRIAERILDGFRDANRDAADGTMISASIGISLFPDNADDPQHLVTHADTALYRAKHDGRGIYRFFETEMGTAVRERRLMENDLRHAISRQELHLVYQPQVDIASGLVTGFEALVRWSHPRQGQISPNVFIPVAEESGLIMQIGEWVLLTACEEAASWTSPLSIAVNVSAVQMQSAQLPEMIAETLRKTGLAPERLEIEITETALVRDIARALISLRQIKALGVRIAMDDFGTGYSSLANLRAFPFDKIKIDQSFIKSVDSNEQSAAIVRAVLGLGAGLKLPVVAEGIERLEELDFLRGETCGEAQGFLLSRPAAISTFAHITEGRETTIEGLGWDIPTPLRVVS